MNNLYRKLQDNPVPIESLSDEKTKFDAIRDNINTLWKRVNSLIKTNGSSSASSIAIASRASAVATTPPSTPSTPTFKWTTIETTYGGGSFNLEPTVVTYKYNGATVRTYTFVYDADNNVATITDNLGKVMTPTFGDNNEITTLTKS